MGAGSGLKRCWGIAALMAQLLIAGVANAQTQDWCQGACKDAKERLVERLAAVDKAAVESCRANVQRQYQTLKRKEETCNCYSPAQLVEMLQELARHRDNGLGACTAEGPKAQLSFIAQQEKDHVARLRTLIAQFQTQTRNLEALGNDAEQGIRDAWGKITEVTFAALLSAIIDGSQADVERRIDDMLARAGGMKNPRGVRKGDLKEWVDALRHDLKGKSKAEAKAMIIESLKTARPRTQDLAAIDKQLAALDAKLLGDAVRRESSTGSDIALDQAYASVLTGLQIAQNHGVRSVATLAKSGTLLAAVPQAIDVIEFGGRILVIGQNIEGVDRLYAAAEQQRTAASMEYRLLVDQRRQLERSRGGR
jgi:hypothetical protein